MNKLIKLKNNIYRPEIDGLRAIAVIAVIINHFNKEILPSGYLGVDIFFVISGFVITSSISSRENKNFGSFLIGFYERRIKRLFPALIFYVLLISILICFFNPNPSVSLKTGFSSLFGLSNIYLLKISTDYFAQSTLFNSFTHTWSLAVEEQFYFIFPILIWSSGYAKKEKNGLKNFYFLLLSLSIISLLAFIFLYDFYQPASYFLMPTRFWEMALGALLYLDLEKRGFVAKLFKNISPSFIFFCIIITFFLPLSFAVFSTIFITILTSLLIASLCNKGNIYKFLSSSAIVKVGTNSYSLYLWHWGVLAISRWTVGITFWSIPLQILIIYILSKFSYKFIEKPFRKIQWSEKKFKSIFKGFIAIIVSALSIYFLEKKLNQKIYLGDKQLDFVDPYYFPNITKNNCFKNKNDNSKDKIIADCFTEVSSGENNLFFVGDSHAQALLPGAELIADKIKFKLSYLITRDIIPSLSKKKSLLKNDIILKKQKKILDRAKDGDIVVLTLWTPGRFFNNWHIKKERYLMQKEFIDWLIKIGQFSKDLKMRKSKLIVLSPTPEFPEADLNQCGLNNAQWFNVLSKKDCLYKVETFQNENFVYKNIISLLNQKAEEHPNLYIFDGLKMMCPNSECSYMQGDSNLYRDSNHLSTFSSKNIFAPNLIKFLLENEIIKLDKIN